MLEFKQIEISDIQKYAKYYCGNGIGNCEKTLSCKYIWKILNSEITEYNDCLIIRNNYPNVGITFDYPLSIKGNTDEALDIIEDYCVKNGIKLTFSALTRNEVATLTKRYASFECFYDRNYSDYLYLNDDICNFSGKKYAGQRNHINKFLSNYPNAIFRKLSNNEKDELMKFLSEWAKEYLPQKAPSAFREFNYIYNFVTSINLDDFCVGCVEIDGKIVAASVAEKVFDTLVIHIEKAKHIYEGVNVFLVREFAKYFKTKYINREDDSGEEGLRISKMQYHPMCLSDKIFMRVKTKADSLKSIPTIKSDRLTIGTIKKTDAEKYYELCADDDRNKYWGYDYKKDLNGELYPNYFYDIAKTDFKNKMCVNFAIRLGTEFIGETVLFEFDYKGTCKLGVRILPQYAGHGYGKEAFYKTMKWALYGLGMRKVLSSCYKENIPSLIMHNELMRKIGEDDQKFYFEREY